MDNTTSTTTSTSYTYTTPPKYQSEKGWECPRCGRINAPWVRQCDCSRDNWHITWTDNTSEDGWWKKYVTCDSDIYKIHPDDLKYTPAPGHVFTVGGSDCWDDSRKIWTNVLKNVSNMKEIN